MSSLVDRSHLDFQLESLVFHGTAGLEVPGMRRQQESHPADLYLKNIGHIFLV